MARLLRTRGAIEDDAENADRNNSTSWEGEIALLTRLQVELLLDIRDLAIEQKTGRERVTIVEE